MSKCPSIVGRLHAYYKYLRISRWDNHAGKTQLDDQGYIYEGSKALRVHVWSRAFSPGSLLQMVGEKVKSKNKSNSFSILRINFRNNSISANVIGAV